MKAAFIIKRLKVIIFIFSLVSVSACKQKADPKAIDAFCNNLLPEYNSKLTEVIISDIFTPAVISRIFAYTNIAAYEALKPQYKDYQSYSGRLRDLQPGPQP